MITVDEVNAVLSLRDPLRKDNGKLDDALIFSLKKDMATVVGRSDFASSLIYYSRLRPTRSTGTIKGAVPLNDRWWYAEKPLSPDVVVDLDLQPVRLALGRFVFDASRMIDTPVELTREAMPDEGFDVEALFFSPSKKWQMSRFKDGLGPVGHQEGDSPERLIEHAIYSLKFRYWSPGSVDLIMERMDGFERKNPTQKQRSHGVLTVEAVNKVLALPSWRGQKKIDWDKVDHVDWAYLEAFGKTKEFRYVSRKPVYAPGMIVATQYGPEWFYGAKEPLPPSEILRLHLQPIGIALAHFVLDASKAMRKPIELAKRQELKRGDHVHTLFRNPSGKWQLSYFEVGEGPVGHRESDDPIDLVHETLRQGYVHWIEGAVDMASESRSNPSDRKKIAEVVRELRSEKRGRELSSKSSKIGRALLIKLAPTLRGAEYVVVSHCVVGGRTEYAFFPSTREGRWPDRMLELATVRDAPSLSAALRQLGYVLRER